LSYLHRFPIDTLKIDRAFISPLDQEEQSLRIVHTIIALAQSLQLTVVAEGIETQGQYRALQTMGCTYGQGYFFARPLPAAKVEELLAQQSLQVLTN